jgi:hypothetical protein
VRDQGSQASDSYFLGINNRAVYAPKGRSHPKQIVSVSARSLPTATSGGGMRRLRGCGQRQAPTRVEEPVRPGAGNSWNSIFPGQTGDRPVCSHACLHTEQAPDSHGAPQPRLAGAERQPEVGTVRDTADPVAGTWPDHPCGPTRSRPYPTRSISNGGAVTHAKTQHGPQIIPTLRPSTAESQLACAQSRDL